MRKFSFAKITSHLQSQGFMIPGSEIYGGLANSWDYGVLGTAVKNLSGENIMFAKIHIMLKLIQQLL